MAERKPVNAASYELGKWLGTVPRDWAGEAGREYLADIRETDPIYAAGRARSSRPVAAGHEQGAGRQRHPGPVDSCRQHDAAAVGRQGRRRITARAKVTGNYDKKGHRFVELDALVVANGKHAAGALPAHRDHPAARAGGGVGAQCARNIFSCRPPRKRGTQYAAASRLYLRRLWNTGSPGQAGR